MIKLFRNKNKKEEVVTEKRPVAASDIYIKNVTYYVDFQGALLNVENPNQNMDFFQEWGGKYYDAGMWIVNYMFEKYPDELLGLEESIQIDTDDFIKNMSNDTKSFFMEPQYPNLVFVDVNKHSTHFHIENNKIIEAENIEVLPGLSRALANEKINKLFKGLTLIDARNLLAQMQILPRKSELDQTISLMNARNKIRKEFLESVTALILISRSKYSVLRAQLFADTFGVDFDFTPFIKKDDEYSLKLQYKK